MLFTKSRRKKRELHEKIRSLETRLNAATDFLEKISRGNFSNLLPFFEQQKTVEGEKFYSMLKLVNERLTHYANQEAERKWVSEGMSEYMNILGGGKGSNLDFYDALLKHLVQYTDANQGGFFVLNDNDPTRPFLELVSCYAFGKKKLLEKQVDLGQGMLGQCFLERETIFVSQVPQYYTKITSGLGDATPSFLLLIPIKFNQEVLGVIELAYFNRPEKYKIDFAEKIAENIASVMLNIRHARRAEELFQESQQKAKALQDREETLRRNVEELVSTQAEMKRNQLELDRQASLLKFIVDNIPFPIFVKDERGRYTIINAAESRLFNLPDQEIIGRDDSHFVRDPKEWEVIHESDLNVLAGDKPLELPLQYFTTISGDAFIFKTTKIPFLNPVTGKKNILGVSIDLTEKLTLERNLLTEKRINRNNVILNITGRQRMLSQKIGFYCETLVRGKLHYAGLLRDALELHEHTLQVLRYGGMPMGIACDSPLLPLDKDLIRELEKIENVWRIYQEAAENILYFTSVEINESNARSEHEKNIVVIEENGEALLKLNNDFMNAYMVYNQNKLAEAF